MNQSFQTISLAVKKYNPLSVRCPYVLELQQRLAVSRRFSSPTNVLCFTEEMRIPQGGECPLPADDEWKVSTLTGNAGTEANVILWVYGDGGVAGPITLGKDNRKQLFLPRQEDEFQVANEG